MKIPIVNQFIRKFWKKGYDNCLKKFAIKNTIFWTVCFCVFNINPVFANPEGGQVIAGSAVISSPNTTTVQVNQSSDKAIIDWRSFNISANEKTQFQQPSVNSITLNRIDPTQGASQIFGQLSANGHIILVNQAGIYFGPSARVDVAGIIASTSDISNENFMAGKYSFDQPSKYAGSVINKGTIRAGSAGLVALLGTAVQNDGLIITKTGTVILASGSKFTLDFIGDGLINFAVDAPAVSQGVDQGGKTLKYGVSNSGKIIANGGHIIMTASAVRGVLRNSINMSGVLVANTVHKKNGVIILSSDGGKTRVTGKIYAKGMHQKGGTVHVLGKQVTLAKNAKIDVSGKKGGGEILIGGDYQGKNSSIQNAKNTYVGKNVVIKADAITSGNGGKIIVWSDDSTQFYGTASATGGLLNGNGGLIETSGKNYLDINQARVNASATLGEAGTWLLDPRNVTINSSTTTCTSPPCFSAGDPTVYTPDTNTSSVNVTDILTALIGGTSVTITTGNTGTQTGTIAVNTAINKTTGSTPVTLTLDSSNGGGTITISNPITAGGTSGALGITLNSGNAITINGDITTNGGDFLSTSQNATNISASRTINTGTGSVNINANASAAGGQDFVMNATSTITTSGSPVNINVNGAGGGTGQATLGFISTSGGALTVRTDTGGNTTGASILQAGAVGTTTLNVGDASFTTGNGAITLTHTNNDFTGVVSLTSKTASNNIAVTDSNALTLGSISMPNGNGTLTINSTGAITQNGSSTITSGTGLLTFNSGLTGAPITLTNDNVFNGAVALSNVNANDVSIKNIGNLSLDTINVGGNFNVTNSNGSIIQSSGAKVITIAGTSNFSSTGTGDSISIANSNKFTGAVSISNQGANDVSIKNTLPLLLDTVNVGNNLSVVTTGAGSTISQTGSTITVPGTSSFNAAANSISLGSNNTFTGAVALTNSGANDVTLTDTSALQLDTSTIGGNLTLAAGGNISEIGAITVSGATTTVSTTASGSDILLGSQANNFGSSAFTFSGTVSNIRDINIQNSNTSTAAPDFSTLTNLRNLTLNYTGTNLTLGTLTLHSGGNLSITAKGVTGGAINQTGPFIVPGTASFSSTVGTSSNRSILLTDSGNQFTSNISIDNGGASANTSITNSLALKLAAVSVGSGTLTFNGNGISQPGGAIIQSSGTGAITLTANAGAIDLSNTNNSLLGVVSITNSAANSVNLVNSNALTLGNITLTGASSLSLTASSITQQAATAITADTLSASTTGITTIANNNSISKLSTVSAGGAFTFNTVAPLNIIGNISANTSSSPLSITSSGLLTISNGISSSSGANGISLTGVGITQNSSTINASSGALSVNAGTGSLTLNPSALLLTTGTATITADSMIFDSSADPAQIGGTGNGTGLATQVILQPSTLNRTIGIAGGTGNIALSQSALNDVRSSNVRIGSTSGSGNITINTWTPAASFASNGVLTLATTGAISQTGVIDLSNNNSSLLLRNASGVTFTNNNIFSNIAANIAGSISITNAATKPITITSITDDAGTVSGITAPGGVTLTASGAGGSITINQNIVTTNNAIVLSGTGISLGANTTINAGTNNMTLNAGNNTLTTGTNSLLYSRGIVALTANTMNLNGSQIGGTATATQTANNVIFTGFSSGTSIGIAGGIGTLQLSSTALDTVKSVNVRIGDSSSGAITIGSWTPSSANFVKNGVLTLDTASTISQTGALNILSSSTRSLLLRDSSSVALTNSGNVLNNVAANISGNISLTNAPTNPLTVTSIIDDLGTINGMTAPGGVTVTASGTGGLLTISGNITSTNNAISLTGLGITLNANNAVDAGSANLSINAGSGTLTTNNNTQFYTTNIATLTADGMTLNTAASSKIGGNSSGTLAQTVILKPSTNGTTIGLGGGTGTLSLGSTELARVFSQNVQIGDSNSGAITIGAWTPPANFATGVLTLDTGNTITQTGAVSLATSGSSLLLRDSTAVTLDNTNNIFTNIAANILGPMTIVNKSTNPITVTSLTDNIGTVTGITASGAINLTASGAGGSLTINQNISSGNNNISLSSVGMTQANNTNINAGSGAISIDAGGGIVQFNNGNLTTTNNSSSAILITNSSTVALGNITANSGTLVLGNGTITGAVTQNSGTTLTANTLVANTTNSINLSNSGNAFASLGSITRGGSLTVNDINALTINGPITAGTISNSVFIQAGGILTLNGNIATSGNNNITLIGTGFNNTAGASALNPGSGRYLVWSGNPANDTRGGLAYNFKQYNANFGSSTVLGSGNGFLYSVAPTVTPLLTGTVSKVYNGTTTATLAGNNYTTSGAIDGDTITLNNPTSGTYDNKNVGVSKLVTTSGITINSASNGAATVYGYQLSSSTAQGDVGTITSASLAVTAQPDTRVYNATTNSNVAPIVTGTVYSGDSITTSPIQSFDNKNVGVNKILTPSGLVINDGNGGNNYSINYITDNHGIITAAPLIVTAQSDTRTYNATTNSSVTPLITGTIYGSDSIMTNPSQVFNNKNVGTGKILTPSGLLINDGNNGNNYSTTYVTNNTGVITQAPLSVNNVTANNKTYDTTTAATINTSSASLNGVYSGDTVNLVSTAASGVFQDKNAGINKNVITSNFSISGADAGNYSLSQPIPTATIYPVYLNSQGIIANSKVYDGTNNAILNISNGTLAGILTPDQGFVSLQSGFGLFATALPGNSIPVTVTSIELTGSEAGNYAVNFPTGLSANIQNPPIISTIPQVLNTSSIVSTIPTQPLLVNVEEIKLPLILRNLLTRYGCINEGPLLIICN